MSVAMSISYETARALFKNGCFTELVANSNLAATGLASLRAKHRLLLAHALFFTDNLELSRSIAESVNENETSNHARREIVLGLVAKQSGFPQDSARHFQHAVYLARQTRDVQEEGWAQLYLFRLLVESEEHEKLVPMLRELRLLVMRVGDPQLTAYLHDSVAALEVQTGRVHEAQRHLARAKGILQRHPSARLQEVVEVNEGCLAILSFNFPLALRHLRTARQLLPITGHAFGANAIDGNEAFAQIATGYFKSANATLRRLAQRVGSGRIPALDCLARLFVALGRLDECDEILDEIAKTPARTQAPAGYSIRWSAVSRAKALLRRGRFLDALLHIHASTETAHSLNDGPLLSALSILEADALCGLNRVEDVGESLIAGADLNITTNLELEGHYQHVCGRVLEHGHNALSAVFTDRAYRLWRHRGNVCAMVEAQSRGGPPLEIRDYDMNSVSALVPRFDTARVLADPTIRPAVVVDTIANALDLSGSPMLLAGELRLLISALGCEAHAEIREMDVGAERVQEHAADRVIPLGIERDRTLALTYRPSPSPAESLLVADIARVARCAIAIERMRREESERTAVWPASDQGDDEAVYVDDQMVTLLGAARRVASVNLPVLITGETGTGKEVLARAIHAASSRAAAAFLPFNCTSCPREMIDAQLFGHRRGAFTGASDHALGVIRASAGGTLLLDEIGETPIEVQPKLLRFLESGEVHPIGETHPVKVDVRVIAATNADLDALVSSGRFREDLFYRLNIVRLHVPPLRERRVEIPTLSQHYLRKYAQEYDKGAAERQ